MVVLLCIMLTGVLRIPPRGVCVWHLQHGVDQCLCSCIACVPHSHTSTHPHTLTTHIIPHTPSLCLHIHHLSLLTLCSTFPHRMSCHVTVPVPAMSCSYTQPVSVSPTLEALRVRPLSGRSRSVTKWSVVLPSALHAFVPSSMSVCVVMFV